MRSPLSTVRGLLPVVVEGDEDLAAVIAVDDPHLVGGREVLLAGKAAPGINEPHRALFKLDGDARVDKARLPRGDDDGLLFEGVKIRPRGKLRSVDGKAGALPQFFYIDFHIEMCFTGTRGQNPLRSAPLLPLFYAV